VNAIYKFRKMNAVYKNVDWKGTEELVKSGQHGYILMKNGDRIIEHYRTITYEVYDVLTRKRIDKWPKK